MTSRGVRVLDVEETTAVAGTHDVDQALAALEAEHIEPWGSPRLTWWRTIPSCRCCGGAVHKWSVEPAKAGSRGAMRVVEWLGE